MHLHIYLPFPRTVQHTLHFETIQFLPLCQLTYGLRFYTSYFQSRWPQWVCFPFARASGDEGINTGSCVFVRKHYLLLMKVTEQRQR